MGKGCTKCLISIYKFMYISAQCRYYCLDRTGMFLCETEGDSHSGVCDE
jgi:hypothetical protein